MDHRAWFLCPLLCVAFLRMYHCHDYISLDYQEDKSLSEPFFLNISIPDMFTCSSLCQQIAKYQVVDCAGGFFNPSCLPCGSVSYDTTNKVCEMNTGNSSDGTLTATTGYRFSDVTASATLVGGCAARSCGDLDLCILDGDGNMSGCVTALLNVTTS